MGFVEFLIVVVLGAAYFRWFMPWFTEGAGRSSNNNSWSGCVENDEPDSLAGEKR
jgi:hypothetical protein